MWRLRAVFAALCMVLCCFASCGGGEPAEPADDSQGPQEVGSEEELTAVREELAADGILLTYGARRVLTQHAKE